jgi:hypothetical protein
VRAKALIHDDGASVDTTITYRRIVDATAGVRGAATTAQL